MFIQDPTFIRDMRVTLLYVPRTQVNTISSIIVTRCGANQFQCSAGNCIYYDNANCDGPCIKSDWVNDGTADCTDGSDENNSDYDLDYDYDNDYDNDDDGII